MVFAGGKDHPQPGIDAAAIDRMAVQPHPGHAGKLLTPLRLPLHVGREVVKPRVRGVQPKPWCVGVHHALVRRGQVGVVGLGHGGRFNRRVFLPAQAALHLVALIDLPVQAFFDARAFALHVGVALAKVVVGVAVVGAGIDLHLGVVQRQLPVQVLAQAVAVAGINRIVGGLPLGCAVVAGHGIGVARAGQAVEAVAVKACGQWFAQVQPGKHAAAADAAGIGLARGCGQHGAAVELAIDLLKIIGVKIIQRRTVRALAVPTDANAQALADFGAGKKRSVAAAKAPQPHREAAAGPIGGGAGGVVGNDIDHPGHGIGPVQSGSGAKDHLNLFGMVEG